MVERERGRERKRKEIGRKGKKEERHRLCPLLNLGVGQDLGEEKKRI